MRRRCALDAAHAESMISVLGNRNPEIKIGERRAGAHRFLEKKPRYPSKADMRITLFQS
jgi:hypothetical protein